MKQANKENQITRSLYGLVVWAGPVLLLGTAVLSLIQPGFIQRHYARAEIAPDLATLTRAEIAQAGLVALTPGQRLALATETVVYLQSWQPVPVALDRLAQLQLPTTGQPLYDQRELAHLGDVKQRTDAIRWLTLLAGLGWGLGLAGLTYYSSAAYRPYRAVRQGGYLTIGLVSLLAATLYWGWGLFFYQFHGLLFPAGSWHFAPGSSLMRLFPESLFYAAGLTIAFRAGLGSLLAIGASYLWAALVTQPHVAAIAEGDSDVVTDLV